MGRPKADAVLAYLVDAGELGATAEDITSDLGFLKRLNVYPILYRLERCGQVTRCGFAKKRTGRKGVWPYIWKVKHG